MAARRDHDVAPLFLHRLFVFALYERRAHRGLFDGGEAELQERVRHRAYGRSFEVRYERGCERDVYRRRLVREHDVHYLRFVHGLLGVLRAYDVALTAQYALVVDNVRPVPRKAYGLDGAVAYALIAVAAVRFFEFEKFGHAPLSVLSEPGQHGLGVEVFYRLGGDGEAFVVHEHVHARLASAEAERPGEFYLVFQPVAGDEFLQTFNDLAGALEVAGAAYANGNFHHFVSVIFFICTILRSRGVIIRNPRR